MVAVEVAAMKQPKPKFHVGETVRIREWRRGRYVDTGKTSKVVKRNCYSNCYGNRYEEKEESRKCWLVLHFLYVEVVGGQRFERWTFRV
jgi:hypothetical protein